MTILHLVKGEIGNLCSLKEQGLVSLESFKTQLICAE
jgi:hypothetical protein